MKEIMSRRKKLLVLVTVLLLLSQIPFAYRRYQLNRLDKAIQLLNGERKPAPEDNWVEYTGVVHVHSFLGGHSSGTFQEIIAAAKLNKLQFVVMTEHVQREINTAAMTLQGIHDGVLFVNGNEVKTSNADRLLVVPGEEALANSEKLSTAEVVATSRNSGALSIIAYPEEFQSWQNQNDIGLEVYNVYTNSRRVNPVVAFFDVLWSHRAYPDLIFANYFQRPEPALKKWDELLAHGKLVAVAGNDSHANIGISLNTSNGSQLIGLKLDPYETSFHLVRLHVLIAKGKSLESKSLLDSIQAGHCFIGFDLFGDPKGFRFEAQNGATTAIQGDDIQFRKGTKLKVSLPVPARLVVLKDGNVFAEETGVTAKEIEVTERGVYRVEAFLPQLGGSVGQQSWIISNPIYVK